MTSERDDDQQVGGEKGDRHERNPQRDDMTRTRRRLWPWLVAALALLFAVGAAIWWLVRPQEGSPERDRATRGNAVPVTVTVAEPVEIPVFYEYNALAHASRRAAIRPRISGYIEEVAFEEGSEVAAGALLYRLDAAPFEAAIAEAEAQRKAIEANLALAEAQVARFSTLIEDGFATGERYDRALARREELAARRAAVEASIRTARLNRGYTEVRAPFSGRLGLSRLNVGDLASPGGPALTDIVDSDPLEVHFEVREEDLPAIRRAAVGDERLRLVAVFDDSSAYAEYGRLEALDNVIDPASGTLTAVALFANPNGLIVPGQSFVVRLLLGRADAILVPTSALSANLDRRIVFRIGPDGTARATPVVTGRRFGKSIVVVEGLAPGDRIVTSNMQAVHHGVDLEITARRSAPLPDLPGAEGQKSPGAAAGVERPAPLGPTHSSPERPGSVAGPGERGFQGRAPQVPQDLGDAPLVGDRPAAGAGGVDSGTAAPRNLSGP